MLTFPTSLVGLEVDELGVSRTNLSTMFDPEGSNPSRLREMQRKLKKNYWIKSKNFSSPRVLSSCVVRLDRGVRHDISLNCGGRF